MILLTGALNKQVKPAAGSVLTWSHVSGRAAEQGCVLMYVTIWVRVWWHLRLHGLVVMGEDMVIERSLILFPAPLSLQTGQVRNSGSGWEIWASLAPW